MKAPLAIAIGIAAICASSGWLMARRGQIQAVARESKAVEARIAEVRNVAASERQRLAAVEAETKQLLNRIAKLTRERRDDRFPTQAEIRERHMQARQLAERGASAEALAGYVWCYDEGFLRTGGLVKDFAALAQAYPSAMVALELRLGEAEDRMGQSIHDDDALQDFVVLDKALNQSERTIAFFDRLPAADERRALIMRLLTEEFLHRRRYADLAVLLPDLTRNDGLDAALKHSPREMPAGFNEQQRVAIERSRAAQRKATLDIAMLRAEILAGRGDRARAKEIVEKIVLLDGSEPTRTALRARLERAGAPDLLDRPR